MKRTLFFIFLQSFLVGMVVAPIRGYDFHWSSFVGFLAYYAYTLFALHRYGKKVPHKYAFWAIFIGLVILETPIWIANFEGTVSSLPDLVMRLLGFVLAYIGYGRRKAWSLSLLGIGLLVNVFMSFPLCHHMTGWEMWIHRQATGSFLPYVDHQPLSADSWDNVCNGKGESLADARKGRITLVDFWSKYCNYCWRGFPDFQRLYDKYKDDPRVCVVSVYAMHYKNDTPAVPEPLLREKGYTFPAYSIPQDHPLLKELSIQAYPRTVLLNADGEVVMNFSGAKPEMVEEEIERLLTECPSTDGR